MGGRKSLMKHFHGRGTLGNLAGEGAGPHGVVWVDRELVKVLQSWVRAAVTAKLALLYPFGTMWRWRAQATNRAGGTSGQVQRLETSLSLAWANTMGHCTPAPSLAFHRPSHKGWHPLHGNGGVVMAWPPPGSTAGFSSSPGLLSYFSR